MRKANTDQTEAGFTLIEMIVALVILGISFGVLLSAFSAHMDRLAFSQSQDKARQLAASLLARGRDLGGAAHGETPDGFAWKISTASYGTDSDHMAWRFAAERMTVTVTWNDAAHRVSLSTLRVAQP